MKGSTHGRRRNPAGGIDLNMVLLFGAGYLAWKNGLFKGIIGDKTTDMPVSTPATTSPGTTTPTTTPTTSDRPTSAQIAAWAQGIGLATCIGEKFVADYGHLPQSLAELDNWGSAKGWRIGGWHC